MFNKLSELFGSPETQDQAPMTTELAVAALLVHLAGIDGDFDSAEHSRISEILQQRFDLEDKDVKDLIARAQKKDADAVDFYQFTSLITQLEMDKRIEIISMMWSVVFADEENHELEDNMVWRVAELIGVSARDRTVLRAKMRTQAKTANA